MNALKRAAEVLRETAEHLECIEADLPKVEAGISIQEAMTILRTTMGGTSYVSIDPPAFNWHSGSGPITLGEWSVYDGKEHYRGRTLQAAMQAFQAASATEPANAVEELQEALGLQPKAIPF